MKNVLSTPHMAMKLNWTFIQERHEEREEKSSSEDLRFDVFLNFDFWVDNKHKLGTSLANDDVTLV